MSNDKIDQFAIFPWNDNFETNIDLIDTQHKKLVAILNRLAYHLAKRASITILDAVFDELIEYTNYHFQSEEKIWDKYFQDDPWYLNHKKTHKTFIEKILALKQQENDKPLDDIVQDIVSFLSQWLGYHILDTDKRMAYVVKSLEAGATMEDAKAHANDVMSGSMKTLIDTVLSMYDNLSVRTMDLMREKALRKQAEEALMASEERWAFILDASRESVWECDIKQEKLFNFENPSACLDFLISNSNNDEKFNDDNIIKIHPGDVKRIKAEFQDHLDGKTKFYSSKYRVLLKNNSWAWVSSRGKVVERDELGTAVRMVGTHSDITEREIGSLIYHQSYQAIIITDANNTIINVNPAFTQMTGYRDTDIIGKSSLSLIHEKYKKNFLPKIRQQINTSGSWKGEIPGLTKSGQEFIALTSISTIRTLDNTTDNYVILFSDITDHKLIENKLLKAKEKAEESNQLKTEFINNMSHEIRTPMNGILGFSELLKEPGLEEAKRDQFISIIQSSGNQLMRVIDDILEISKLGTKQVSAIEEPVCLNDLLLEYFAIFDIKAKDNGIPLYLKQGLSDEKSTIVTDKTKLGKILSNLIENALKFTSEGFVEFGYQVDNKMLELYVKDTGVGISADKKEIIFERFSQEEKTISRKVGGLGLGLSIAKENAELLGGVISVQSEKGKGAKFIVSIPYKPISQDALINNEDDSDKHHHTILIAEDEEVNYLYIKSLLNLYEPNVNILHAKNGEEAIKICESSPQIDLVLLDIKMPGMSGFEAATPIRKLQPKTPIVMQTAYSSSTEKEKSFSLGCDEFITKPIMKTTLDEILNKYLNES